MRFARTAYPSPGAVGIANGARGRDLHLGLDDVLFPVALAGGNVAGQNKSGERRHSDVVRATYARFQHSAAPHRNISRTAYFFHAFGFAVSAHSTKFYIDDPAGAHLDGCARVLGIVNGFVQTNGSFDLWLQQRVVVHVVPR